MQDWSGSSFSEATQGYVLLCRLTRGQKPSGSLQTSGHMGLYALLCYSLQRDISLPPIGSMSYFQKADVSGQNISVESKKKKNK